MAVVLIHHLETIWEAGYNKFATSFDNLVDNLYEWLNENSHLYNKTILTRFEDTKLEEGHSLISHMIDYVYQYDYGWDESLKNDMENFGETMVDGGNHSDYVWVPDWVKKLSGETVYLCGAFDGECIEDITIALNSVNAKIIRIENLIVG